jgi:hypothetical protein
VPALTVKGATDDEIQNFEEMVLGPPYGEQPHLLILDNVLSSPTKSCLVTADD